MIQMPRRSVTRFFIPLIDVLILLFCIFLLMPMFREEQTAGQEDGSQEAAADLGRDKASLEAEVRRLTRELEDLRTRYQPHIDLEKVRAELERLRKEKAQALQQRLFVRVLDIDPRTGALLFYDPAAPDKPGFRIVSAEAARMLIRRHREEAGDRELYYVFLFPRADTGYPTEQQFEQYKRWFADVASGVGNAGAPR